MSDAHRDRGGVHRNGGRISLALRLLPGSIECCWERAIGQLINNKYYAYIHILVQ